MKITHRKITASANKYTNIMSSENIDVLDDDEVIDEDFNAKWNKKYGEPATEVFETDDFLAWLKEVKDFA